MAKTLKDFLNERQLGPMVVKNPDEQKFIDKHVVAKTADRNGNDDELFKGSKVKMADRPKHRKGYNPGEDEEVYEALKGDQHKIDANKNGKVDAHDFHLLRKKKKVAEEAEELEELSTNTLRSYRAKAKDDAYDAADVDDDRRLRKRSMGSWDAGKKILKRGDALRKEETEELEELSHDTLRGYRMKAKSIADNEGGKDRTASRELAGRKSYGGRMAGIPKAKVMAKEEAEQIDELSKATLGSYVVKSLAPSSKKSISNLASKGGYKLGQAHDDDYTAGEKEDAKSVKRSLGVLTAVRKMTKEQSELEEKLDMKKASMGTVVKDFQKSDAPQFMGKSQKKRQVMAIAAKLSAERGDKPLNKEERLLVKLADISETHQRTMVSVFEKLNEDNQYAFMQACDTADGIEQMLDFSISYRGE